jgi:hypothetical protein
VQWEGGSVVVEDTAAITARDLRVEGAYSTNGGSPDEATMDGVNELFIRAQAQFPAIIAQIEPTSAADCPYEGFTVGDYVTAPDGAGTQIIKCWSITCQQDPMGYAIWSAELNAKLDVPQRRNDQLLQQIGGKNQIIRGVLD